MATWYRKSVPPHSPNSRSQHSGQYGHRDGFDVVAGGELRASRTSRTSGAVAAASRRCSSIGAVWPQERSHLTVGLHASSASFARFFVFTHCRSLGLGIALTLCPRRTYS